MGLCCFKCRIKMSTEGYSSEECLNIYTGFPNTKQLFFAVSNSC